MRVFCGPIQRFLASFRIRIWMVPWLIVELGVCVRMSLRRLECRSASLVTVGGVPFPFCRVWGQVLSPPTGGFAAVKIMSGALCPSATLRADVSASSLCTNSLWMCWQRCFAAR
jgi:hypothetical protein